MPLPALALSKAVPRRVDVLVVGIDESGLRGVPDAQDAAYAKRFGMSIAEMAEAVGAKPAAGSRRTLPAAGDGPRVVVVGMGPAGESTAGGPSTRRRCRRPAGRLDGRRSDHGRGRARDVEPGRSQRGRRGSTARHLPVHAPRHRTASGGIHRDDHRGAPRQHSRDRRGGRRPDAGPRRRAGARVGQHAGQPALSGVVRRPGRRTGEGLSRIGRDPRREGVGPRRVRRSARGRRRIGPAAAVGPVQLCPAWRQDPSGAGRQGHHVRHRRAQPQAGRRHVHDEVRHVRRGRGAGRHPGDRRVGSEDQDHRVRGAGREHAVGWRVPALGRADHVRREDRGERQLRCRGPAGDGRRPGPRRRRTSRI